MPIAVLVSFNVLKNRPDDGLISLNMLPVLSSYMLCMILRKYIRNGNMLQCLIKSYSLS
jgi:hypothetical protein